MEFVLFDSMITTVLNGLSHGLLAWPWWKVLVATLVLTHITIVSVTIFLHRCQAHRALDLHPIASHFFRFWLWLTTAQVTKEWAAIHRKHHAKCETPEDPHSPITRGIKTVLFTGAELYRAEAENPETIEKYGKGTPDDWLERNIYTKRQTLGITIMFVIDVALFGVLGLAVWAVQMMWIPVWAAGVINGLGHYVGYRNFDCEDASTNLSPIAFFIGGEELHNNHHTFATSAKFSVKPWEFDLGWGYIRILQALGLAKVKKIAPKPKKLQAAKTADIETLHAIITNRYEVMARYAKTLQNAYRTEVGQIKETAFKWHEVKTWLTKDEAKLTPNEQTDLATLMEQNTSVRTYVEMRRDLSVIWGRSNATAEQLLSDLQDWCHRAEQSGIQALADFSLRLRRYA